MQTTNTSTNNQNDIVSEQLAIKALRAKSRKSRRHLREKRRNAANQVKLNKVDISAYKATLDGFAKKNKLPNHFNEIFNEARKFAYTKKEYVDNKGVTRSLSSRGQRKLLEVLVVLLTNCDFLSGQVGLAKKQHMDTISHDAFMLQHAKRFGYAISSSSWYRYIEILKTMKIFSGEAIRLFSKDYKTVRSESSYKWLSKAFLMRLGVFKDHIRASIKLAYQKATSKGLCFIWKMKNEQALIITDEFDLSLAPIPPNIQPN